MPVMLNVRRMYLDDFEIDDDYDKCFVFYGLESDVVSEILERQEFEYDAVDNAWKIVADDDMMYVIEVYDYVDVDSPSIEVRGEEKKYLLRVLYSLLDSIKKGFE